MAKGAVWRLAATMMAMGLAAGADENATADPTVTTYLVVEDGLLKALEGRVPDSFQPMAKSALDAAAVAAHAARGGHVVWIAGPEGLPPDLWVGAFRPSAEALAVAPSASSPLPIEPGAMGPARLASAYIGPPKEMPIHNVDEEVRADFLPLLEARDRFGEVVGYPAVLMSHYAPSLALRRFDGSECFLYFFDEPLQAMGADGWAALLGGIEHRLKNRIQVTSLSANYASYHPGERAQIRLRLKNRGPRAVAVELRFSMQAPNSQEFVPLQTLRRCPEGGSETEALCDFLPGDRPGLWRVRVDVCVDPEHPELLAIEGNPQPIDRRETSFVLQDETIETERILSLDGPRIRLDDRDAFWVGTHYYPSSSWWEWAWRDYHPAKATADFAAIRKAGYRIVRVWIDPVLDEDVLRAMDTAIEFAAQNGIVLDICLFTQWTKKIGFERPNGEHVLFDFRAAQDFNVYSLSLRNLELQREYVRVLGRRWKDAGNVVFNLANEAYVRDPEPSQMDEEAQAWEEAKLERGYVRDSMLFRRWADEITAAFREVGATQPILPGYIFTPYDGGDNTISNGHGDIVPWHSYYPPPQTASTLRHADVSSLGRPLILEEFGIGGWNTLGHYDADAHYALAGGAAVAMSYEWGVSWLSREACYWPLPIRDASKLTFEEDWFEPLKAMGEAWPDHGVGLCGWPSGFGYGSIYHGTPFPAAAAQALGRMGLMGEGWAPVLYDEAVYILAPMGTSEGLKAFEATAMKLWRAKVPFGVWQASVLDQLPASAKILICPAAPAEAASGLEAIRGRGVKVYSGADESWASQSELPSVPVQAGEEIDLLVRRTVDGTIYVLAGPDRDGVTVKLPGGEVRLDLRGFALIHESAGGIDAVEGAGAIAINGLPVVTVEKGRVLMRSEDGRPLSASGQLRLMVTEPTALVWARPVAAVGLSDGIGFGPRSAATYDSPQTRIDVDDQLARYVVHMTLQP